MPRIEWELTLVRLILVKIFQILGLGFRLAEAGVASSGLDKN